MDRKDWLDAAAVVGWVSVWSALVYLVLRNPHEILVLAE